MQSKMNKYTDLEALHRELKIDAKENGIRILSNNDLINIVKKAISFNNKRNKVIDDRESTVSLRFGTKR